MKNALSIAVAGLALCAAANAAVITLISPTVNDGSFEESYSTADNTTYLKVNNDTAIWDLSNANTSTRGIMESPNGMLWSDRTGSVNPNTAIGTGAYVDAGQSTTLYVYNRGAESIYGTTDGTVAAVEGDVLNYSFDFNRHTAAATYANSVLTVRMHLDGTQSAAFNAGEADMNGGAGGWVTRSGSYTLTQADADSVNAGSFQFGVSMNSANGGGAIYADNFNLSVTQAIPEPATLGLLGLAFGGLVMLRRRKK